MSEFDEEQVLVTGGLGFIGSHIVDHLMKSGARVRVLDDMSNGDPSNVEKWKKDPSFEIIIGDIRDSDTVKKALQDVSYVFHQAAKVSVPLSVENPHLVMDVNAMGTTTLLDGCRLLDVRKVVIASSSSVYGDTPTLPKVESMPLSPISPYAVSKLAQEKLSVAFYRTYGLNTTALRYFNVFGPRQRVGAYAGVISIFINQAKAHEPVTIDGDGQQTRDFTYVDDVVASNLLAATSIKSKGEVYNVGGGSRITIEDLADKIISITNSQSIKTFGPPRAGDVHDSLASIEKANQDLGYKPSVDIDTGLAKTVEWLLR